MYVKNIYTYIYIYIYIYILCVVVRVCVRARAWFCVFMALDLKRQRVSAEVLGRLELRLTGPKRCHSTKP